MFIEASALMASDIDHLMPLYWSTTRWRTTSRCQASGPIIQDFLFNRECIVWLIRRPIVQRQASLRMYAGVARGEGRFLNRWSATGEFGHVLRHMQGSLKVGSALFHFWIEAV